MNSFRCHSSSPSRTVGQGLVMQSPFSAAYPGVQSSLWDWLSFETGCPSVEIETLGYYRLPRWGMSKRYFLADVGSRRPFAGWAREQREQNLAPVLNDSQSHR